MKITIYTTTNCAYCPMVKKYLAQKAPENTIFEIVNLDEQPEQREKLFKYTGAMTVPITVFSHEYDFGQEIETKYVVGWKPAELAKALK